MASRRSLCRSAAWLPTRLATLGNTISLRMESRLKQTGTTACNPQQPRKLRGLLLSLLLGACPAVSTGEPVTTDQPARRAISLAPHVTELIYAAGAGHYLLATVVSSDHPEAARALPRVGDGVTVHPERLLAWRPDLIAAWQPTHVLTALGPALAQLGIPLIYSRPRSLDDIAVEILRYGRIFGTEATAQSNASAWRNRLSALRERHRNLPPLTVFIELGGEPLYTLGPDPLLRDVLATCSAVNLYDDSPTPALTVAMEDVLIRRPDVLLLPARKPTQARERVAVWRRHALPAALAEHFHAYDPDLLHRPGPRLLDAAEALCADLERIRLAQADNKH